MGQQIFLSTLHCVAFSCVSHFSYFELGEICETIEKSPLNSPSRRPIRLHLFSLFLAHCALYILNTMTGNLEILKEDYLLDSITVEDDDLLSGNGNGGVSEQRPELWFQQRKAETGAAIRKLHSSPVLHPKLNIDHL